MTYHFELCWDCEEAPAQHESCWGDLLCGVCMSKLEEENEDYIKRCNNNDTCDIGC